MRKFKKNKSLILSIISFFAIFSLAFFFCFNKNAYRNMLLKSWHTPYEIVVFESDDWI